jgi:hypothetical protein
VLKLLQLVAATKVNEPSLTTQQSVEFSGYQTQYRYAVWPEMYPDNVQHFSSYRSRTQSISITRWYAEIVAVSREDHQIHTKISCAQVHSLFLSQPMVYPTLFPGRLQNVKCWQNFIKMKTAIQL